MLEETIELHRAGRLDAAERGYRQLLKETPDNAEVLHLLGILRGQRGDLPDGLQLVQRASELDPENAACRHTLGEMRLREGALDQAAAAFDKARELNPNLSAAHVGLGQVALRQGRLDAAESHFKVALRADEKDVQAITGLGNIAQARGDATRALQLLTQAAELAPDDPVVQASYAQAMLDQDMPDFAARALDNAFAVRPDFPLAQVLRAHVHVRKGEIAAALSLYESLLARGEQAAMARAGLGDIARVEGRHADAVAQYDEALRLQPDLHHAAVRRAEALAAGGQATQAIDDLRRYVAGHPDARTAHVALARLLTRAGRYDEALTAWQSAEARWPEDVDLKAQHALTLDRAGHSREAQEQAEIAAASPRPAIAMLRARGALLAGDPAAAVQRLQRVEDSRFDGKPPQLARRHKRLLGLAFDALEQWSDAVQAFMAAQPHDGPPELASLDGKGAQMRELADQPELAGARGAAPVLLCGLPGSGVEQVAALLADQPGWFVFRGRFRNAAGIPGNSVDPGWQQGLDQGGLALLARRYRRALARSEAPADANTVDWIPVLDARVVPALKRALPGVRLLVAQRPVRDTLLHWLAFGSAHGYGVPDPATGARWLRLAQVHLNQAAGMLPTLHVDTTPLLEPGGEDARAALATFLGVDAVATGPRANAATIGHGGMPTSFPADHAAHYREALTEAFAVLEDAVFADKN